MLLGDMNVILDTRVEELLVSSEGLLMKSVLVCTFSDILACVNVVRRVTGCELIFVFLYDFDCVGESTDTSLIGKVVGKVFFSDGTETDVMVYWNSGTECLIPTWESETEENVLRVTEPELEYESVGIESLAIVNKETTDSGVRLL